MWAITVINLGQEFCFVESAKTKVGFRYWEIKLFRSNVAVGLIWRNNYCNDRTFSVGSFHIDIGC